MMANQQRRTSLYIPGYKDNAVIQLIFAIAVAYIMFAISWAIVLIVTNGDRNFFAQYFTANVSLGTAADIKAHWWTFLTYGWLMMPDAPLQVLSNALWIYMFGSVVQMLVGYRQVIPLYFYALTAGGVVYALLVSMLPSMATAHSFLGGTGGILALAVAAVTIAPDYRFYLTETLSIPLMLVAGVFGILALISSAFAIPVLALTLTGGLVGFAYIKLLRSGYRPGEWIYDIFAGLDRMVTPKAERRPQFRREAKMQRAKIIVGGKVPQRKIDEILDKINQKGYNSLTKEEKEMLLQAGKE